MTERRVIGGRVVVRLPGAPAAHSRDVLAGVVPPVTPRDASTVMLLRAAGSSPAPGAARAAADASLAGPGVLAGPGASAGPDGAGGFEVYLLRRPSSMVFAPGAHVFPGGSVDPADARASVPWAGPDPAAWGDSLGAPPDLARALVCAAVRETFEECGVLLAGDASGAVLASTSGADWDADRAVIAAGELTLPDMLTRRGLVLRADLLRPWSRWITPVSERRRFDTRFFAAALPAGQEPRHARGEADSATWLPPAAALAAARDGRVVLLPPTAITLADLRACATAGAALSQPRHVIPLEPEILLTDDEIWLALPAGLEYPG